MVFTPATGYKITGITVNGVAQTVTDESSYTYPAQQSVTGAINVVVTTAKKSYSVTGSIDNGGSVTNGTQDVPYGDSNAVMTFTPATGYKITGVTVNGVAQSFSESSYTYPATNVTGDIKVVVTTTLKSYSVTGTIDNGGKVTNGSQTVTHGANSAVMTFTPATGYKITGITITVNGTAASVQVTDENSYTYSAANVTAPVTVTVSTTEKTCTITYVAGEGGTVKLIGTENWLTQATETVLVKTGNPVGAAVLPNTGYKFIGWYAGDKLVSKNANLVPGKTGDLYVAATYTARFELALVELTIEVADPQGDESYIFTVTGNPSDGSAFNPMKVVLTKANNYKVTIKDIPVGTYTVHEEDGWSWRQEMVEDQKVLLGESRTATFEFKVVERIYWLSGESYNKRKKGGSSNG